MNERLPYEEQLPQQWDDLPLPDENAAWEDMKQRLEEDGDKKPVAWWRRGCGLWALLLPVLLVTGWLLYEKTGWFKSKDEKEIISKTIESVDRPVSSEPSSFERKNQSAIVPGKNDHADTMVIVTSESSKQESASAPGNNKRIPAQQNNTTTTKTETGFSVKAPVTGKIKKRTKTAAKMNNGAPRVNTDGNNGSLPDKILQNDTIKTTGTEQPEPLNTGNKNQPLQDSLPVKTITDTATKSQPVTDLVKEKVAENKDKKQKKEKEKSPLFFSAGLGLFQQLPVAGQKLTPYSASGRKSSLADYIPSLYVRMTKENKWFLHTEFRYGAPQSAKEFVYAAQSAQDTSGGVIFTRTTSSKLKKTFYHQLPLTFNYYIKPGWSIGAGIQVNKFSTAIAEREVRRTNSITGQDSLLSKGIISDRADSSFSVFKKTYLLGVFETQYQLKRFSLGAKYSFGLQPYIQFTIPGSNPQKERTQSLQLFIRYQLWRSKNK